MPAALQTSACRILGHNNHKVLVCALKSSYSPSTPPFDISIGVCEKKERTKAKSDREGKNKPDRHNEKFVEPHPEDKKIIPNSSIETNEKEIPDACPLRPW